MNNRYVAPIIGSIIGVSFLLLNYIFSQPNLVPQLKSSFEVVDTYKGCDVVRYSPHQAATYKYFLYCEKNK